MARRLEQLITFVDAINADKNQLADIINQTKSKILDLAIRGKLVSQDPNDEPTSVLLERIRAEKEELIKQGKIKRDKKESVIFRGDDNSFYIQFVLFLIQYLLMPILSPSCYNTHHTKIYHYIFYIQTIL